MNQGESPKRIPPSIPPSSARKRTNTRGAKPARHGDTEAANRSNADRAYSGRLRDSESREHPACPREQGAAKSVPRSTRSSGSGRPASSNRSASEQRASRNYRSAQMRNGEGGAAGAASSRPGSADARSSASPSTSTSARSGAARTDATSSYNQRVRRESIKHRESGEGSQVPPVAREYSSRAGAPPSYAPRRNAPSFQPRSTASTTRHAQRAQTFSPARPVTLPPAQVSPPAPRKRKRSKGKIATLVVVVVLALLIAWPIVLVNWASGKINHVDALSGRAATPGTTYLLAGSDSREGTEILDDAEGQRSDTIMLLHHAENGNSYLISLPRDTWVEIPGFGNGKINASYAYGGPQLLTQTVENLSGLTVDHFVQIGMDGVTNVVDSVGGVELCLDYDVNDVRSELVWEAGCHVADGHTALAFARMRYADPNGDIGRAERQRQVIGAIVKNVSKPSTALNPVKQMQISSAGAEAVSADHDTSALDLARMAWYFRQATSNGNTGTPPIATLTLPTNQGVAVQLDEQLTPQFFDRLADGSLTADELKEYAF